MGHEQMKVKAGPKKQTALHMAFEKKDLDMARVFVDHGASIDSKNVSLVPSDLTMFDSGGSNTDD